MQYFNYKVQCDGGQPDGGAHHRCLWLRCARLALLDGPTDYIYEIYLYMCVLMCALYSLYTRCTRSTRGCPMASTGLRMLSDSSSTSFSHTSASPGTSSCLAGWVKTTVSKRVLILRTWSLFRTFLAFWVLNGSLFIFQGPYFHCFSFIHAQECQFSLHV